MADANFRRNLIHYCEIWSDEQTISATTGAESYDGTLVASDVICRFTDKVSGFANRGEGKPFTRDPLVLFDNDAPVQKGYQIRNVKFRSDDSNFDAGPFIMTAIRRRNSVGPHHVSVGYERVDTNANST